MAESETPSKTIGLQKNNVKYVERRAVRAITKNEKDEIIIIYAKKDNYYKLPGGGIEGDEDHKIAVLREAMEETGCEVRVTGDCIAEVEEWRNDLHQVSYCYESSLVRDTGVPELTEDEVEDGLQHEWASIRVALEKMRAAQPTSELGRYIKERDIFFVECFLLASKEIRESDSN
jgi:8-oxo-dGTP diphosphatase